MKIHLAQVRDKVLQRADRCLGRLAGPQLLYEEVRGHHLARMEQQQRQEEALLPPLQLERASLHQDLERAQDAELDVLHQAGSTTVKDGCPDATRERRVSVA